MWPLPPTHAPVRIALLSALLCAACTPQVVRQEVPLALTDLPARPVPPLDPSDKDVANLIIAQDEVLGACYSQMSRIRTLLETPR